MPGLRALLTIAILLLACEASAFVDAPPRSPTVLVDVQGTTAFLVFLDYQTTALGPGDFCGLALNLLAPMVGVVGAPVIVDGATFMPLPQFAFTPNPAVGSSFGGISPGVWEGFFSNVTSPLSAGTIVYIVFQVSIAPGTTYLDLEVAIRGAGDIIASDEVSVSGMATGANQNILPAGCLLDATSPTMSHSADRGAVFPGNSAACAGMMGAGPHTDNGYFRTYRPLDFGFVAPADIASVTFGIERAIPGPGFMDQPVEIRLYLDPTPPDPAPAAQLILLHTEFLNVPDPGGPTLFNAPITAAPPITLMPMDNLVIELFTPDAFFAGTDHNFRIGSNDLGESSPGYIRAADCGINEPVPVAAVGVPNMHIILDVQLAGGAPPPPPTCMLMAPVPPTQGDISFDLDTTTGGCTEVDIEWAFSTDGGTTFTPCTPAPSSPLANPAPGAPAGVANFVWDSRADAVGAVASQAVDVIALVSDDIYRGAPAVCMQSLSVDNSSICTMLCGDCDLNGSAPDVLDSLTAAQIAVAIVVPSVPQTGCCDIDSDMDIDVIDSLVIAQSAVALPVALTCP